VRVILETGPGLESLPQIPLNDSENTVKKPN
jgi:hypothetical protein